MSADQSTELRHAAGGGSLPAVVVGFRGEGLDAVSRESQVPAHELESWKRIFLEQGARGLKTRSDPEERELTLPSAKIGELMMRLELAEHLIEKRGLTDEWKKQRR